MHSSRSQQSIVLYAAAALATLALLVWFTVVLQEAQTRSQYRRAYQQLTGRIMVNAELESRQAADPRSLAVARR